MIVGVGDDIRVPKPQHVRSTGTREAAGMINLKYCLIGVICAIDEGGTFDYLM